MMLDKLRIVIKNPKRVFYGYRERLLRRRREEVLTEESIRHFPSSEKTRRVFFVKSKYDYGDRARGLSFEENNFLHTLIHSGHEVFAFDPLFTMKKYGKKMMNRILREAVYRWSPDIVFFVLFKDEIEFETLLEIRDVMKIKTLNWFTDDHWRFESFSRYYAPCFSYIVTTYKPAFEKYREIGYENVIVSQWACNHFLYRKLDLPCKYDVTFIGQPHGDRPKVIKKIINSGIRVDTFGFGWPTGIVSTFEMIKIFNQSKLNLNLSNASRGTTNQIKGRDFEIPGCGGFMLTAYTEELSEYYKFGEEIETYQSVDELIEKVRHYINHDDQREEIAAKGHQRVLKEHTYIHRFNYIFNHII
jgi:spore maturation protein CgeB